MFAELRTKDVIILGCGNILFGDDGFGPAVIERLEQAGPLPAHAFAEDVGTSVKQLLVDMAYGDPRPKCVIIVDAVDRPGHLPGDVFEIAPDEIPMNKLSDFSVHAFPSGNLLKQLKDQHGVDVVILACQVSPLPNEVHQGLSAPAQKAVEPAVRRILEIVARYGR
ncbi:MAG: hydrogenase maturation protease [Planctomycetota bacterium]|nr:hydrogenase maturation protease [Planctomycetota bacterium]